MFEKILLLLKLSKNEAITVILTVKATSWLTSCTNTAITTGGIRAISVKICWLKNNFWKRNNNKMIFVYNKALTWGSLFATTHFELKFTICFILSIISFISRDQGKLLTKFRSLELLCPCYLHGWFCII